MGPYVLDIVAIVISLLAFGFGIVSFVKSNNLTKGQVEMQIREMVSSAKSRYADRAIQLSQDSNNETLKASVSSALEDVCNAYDEACAKYVDKKVDKERFKMLYRTEIRNLVQDDNTKDKYVMPQSKFSTTVKVYNEWNNEL